MQLYQINNDIFSFADIEENILKFSMEAQRTLNGQRNIKKNEAGVIWLPDFRQYYKATVV